jgi:hypothetical protein
MMPIPPDNRMKFFVFVVESPSPVDLYHRRSEGEIIRQTVNLNQIPCIVRTAVNLEAFVASLKIGLPEEMKSYEGLIPILHISAHGDSEGLQLSDGTVIPWSNLRQLLTPINAALNNGLLVCLSCCEGYSGTRMAMFVEDEGRPFYAIVANSGKPLWSDTAVAYLTFYHLLSKGEFIVNAVEAMRAASGNHAFWVETAEKARQGYLDYIKTVNLPAAQEQLEETTAQEEPSYLAKLRRVGEETKP